MSVAGASFVELSLSEGAIRRLAPAGYYFALHVGFAAALIEINNLPPKWVHHYCENGLILQDPIMRWLYGSVGSVRWSEMEIDDPAGVFEQAERFGLSYGAVLSLRSDNGAATRSFGVVARGDREFDDSELSQLENHLKEPHDQHLPPDNLTASELEALVLLGQGLRQKQVAYELGISEGAVKQRLAGAKRKLKAQTMVQAVMRARAVGLLEG